MESEKTGDQVTKLWHHRPTHVFRPQSAYILTAATLHKEHFFQGPERLRLLHNALLELAEKYEWQIQARAVFSNHYHWIGISPENSLTLKKFVSHLHTVTAAKINHLDGTPSRKVWFEFWDTCLTYEESYYARLKYVHQNPVHHGICNNAGDYPWCSARWFMMNAEKSFYRKIESYRIDHLNIQDDF